MRKISVAFMVVSVLLMPALVGCGGTSSPPGQAPEEAYVNRYPEGGYDHWLDRDFGNIQINDSGGNDITHIAVDLWYCANGIYNVDDAVMFEIGEYEASLKGYAIPQSNELLNYQDVVDNVFTENGIAQLEQTSIGFPGNLLIRKTADKVYRMGGWKTGFSIEDNLTAMRTKELAENRIVLAADYVVKGFIDDPDGPDYSEPDHFTVGFTIAKVGGKWLVDDYVYPEAYQE